MLPVPAADPPRGGKRQEAEDHVDDLRREQKDRGAQERAPHPGAVCVSSITRRFSTAFPTPQPKRPSRIV